MRNDRMVPGAEVLLMKHSILFAIVISSLHAHVLGGCSGPNSNGGKSNSSNITNSRFAGSTSNAPLETGGEAIPHPPADSEPWDASVGSEEIPEDPVQLRKRALAELEAGNAERAISMIDVLLILNPRDLELLEIRGEIMLKQGLTEDATVDLRRCCKEGRRSCCR